MATDKKTPGKKTGHAKTTKTAMQKGAIKQSGKETSMEEAITIDKPTDVVLETLNLDSDTPAQPSSVNHDLTMDIDWNQFNTLETKETQSDSLQKPEESFEKPIEHEKSSPSENNPETGWEDVLTHAFGISTKKEEPARTKLEETIVVKATTINDSLDAWMQGLIGLEEEADNASKKTNSTDSEQLAKNLKSVSISEQKSLRPDSDPKATDSFLESILDEISPEFQNAKADIDIAKPSGKMEQQVTLEASTASGQKPKRQDLESKVSDSFLENILDEVFPEFHTYEAETIAPITSTNITTETLHTNTPYIVSDNASIFIDEETPENTPNFETKLDNISLQADNLVQSELIQADHLKFTNSLTNESSTRTPYQDNKPAPVDSITLDTGIIISDEPLPITQSVMSSIQATDALIREETHHFETDTIALHMDTTEDPLSIEVTEEGYALSTSTSVASHTTTQQMPVTLELTIEEPLSNLNTDILTNSQAAETSDTSLTEDLIDLIKTEQPNDFTKLEKLTTEEQHDLLTASINEEVHPIRFDVEATTDDALNITHTPNELADTLYSEQLFLNGPIIDPHIMNAHVSFIPVKNAQQDWVFSVVNFGTPDKQTFYMERPITQPQSEAVFNDITFNFPLALQDGNEQKTEHSWHIKEHEINAIIEPTLNKEEPEAPKAPVIRIDPQFVDEALDFDFSDLTQTLSTDIPETIDTPFLKDEPFFEQPHDQFIDDVVFEEVHPEESLHTEPFHQPFSPSLSIKPKGISQPSQYLHFEVGQTVHHAQYGEGTIQKISHAPHQNVILHIEFKKYGKRLIDPALTQFKQGNMVSV